MVEQTLFNWVKAHREGTVKGADSRWKVTAEQMEISRLRADLARVTVERDIRRLVDAIGGAQQPGH